MCPQIASIYGNGAKFKPFIMCLYTSVRQIFSAKNYNVGAFVVLEMQNVEQYLNISTKVLNICIWNCGDEVEKKNCFIILLNKHMMWMFYAEKKMIRVCA